MNKFRLSWATPRIVHKNLCFIFDMYFTSLKRCSYYCMLKILYLEMILTAKIVPLFFSVTVCCLYSAADWSNTVDESLAFTSGLLSAAFLRMNLLSSAAAAWDTASSSEAMKELEAAVDGLPALLCAKLLWRNLQALTVPKPPIEKIIKKLLKWFVYLPSPSLCRKSRALRSN